MRLRNSLTDRVATEQDASGEDVVLVFLVEVLANDKGGWHVDEGGANPIEDAVSEEHPLDDLDERRRQATEGQYSCTQQACYPVAPVTQTADEGHW